MPGAVGHKLLDTKAAVAYLGGHVNGKKLRFHRAEIGAVRLGRLWYWPRENLDAWVAKNTDPPTPEAKSKKRRRAAA